jgi:hypothetical protein
MWKTCILSAFQRHIPTITEGLAQGVNPRTYVLLISLMKIRKSINENSLNLNILFLNISKQNTKKINFVAKTAGTLSQALSRNTRIK